MTRYVGQVVLVVRADETQQGAVRDAIALIDKSATISAMLEWRRAVRSWRLLWRLPPTAMATTCAPRDAANTRMGTPMSRRASVLLLAAMFPLGIGVAMAQSQPFQSVQRGNIGTGIGQQALPAGTVFEPRVDATVQYVANIELLANGLPHIDMAGLELAPGFYASHSTDSITAAIDYSLIGRVWEESDFDDVSHRLAANGQWNAVPEWFQLRGQASYSDSVIDPSAGLNYGGLGIFGAGNLAEVGTASVTPVLQHRFSDLQLDAEYTYARVWYLDVDENQPIVGFISEQDSEDQSARVTFGTFEEGSRVLAKVFYEWQRSDFEVALPYEYERAGFDGGFRFARTLSLVGDIGRESDLDESTTEGGLDSDFWSAGLRWEPSDRTSAEARYGERFFGDSYTFRANHRARLFEFDASYTEAPTIETRLLSLGGFQPGELPGGPPGVGTGGLSSTPFVGRDARIGVTAVGSITRLNLTGVYYERDYIRDVLGDEVRSGVELGVTRQLASNLSTDVNVYYTEFESDLTGLGGPASEPEVYYDTQVILRLNRASGPHFTLGGETGYLIRTGDGDYEGWWVALRLRWLP